MAKQLLSTPSKTVETREKAVVFTAISPTPSPEILTGCTCSRFFYGNVLAGLRAGLIFTP